MPRIDTIFTPDGKPHQCFAVDATEKVKHCNYTRDMPKLVTIYGAKGEEYKCYPVEAAEKVANDGFTADKPEHVKATRKRKSKPKEELFEPTATTKGDELRAMTDTEAASDG